MHRSPDVVNRNKDWYRVYVGHAIGMPRHNSKVAFSIVSEKSNKKGLDDEEYECHPEGEEHCVSVQPTLLEEWILTKTTAAIEPYEVT